MNIGYPILSQEKYRMANKMGYGKIWRRIKESTDIKTMQDLAKVVASSQPTISARKKENKFPAEWAYEVAQKYDLLTEWIMKGKGPRTLKEAKDIKINLIADIEKWILDTQKNNPGALNWFDMEFKRKFPEFDDWLKEK